MESLAIIHSWKESLNSILHPIYMSISHIFGTPGIVYSEFVSPLRMTLYPHLLTLCIR